ncbi:LexA family transcriptional regulator [Millionella massiliensis]|uniref:LexA family transcriptional regulator n=1 Tax=Millionella massiliensis TaxID=1871023 RepID=UPI0008D95E33|nr:S24 family peptidase [Millionella massiliensis]
MESTVKQRLIEYLDFKNISKSEFGRRIGVSAAFVGSMRKSIQPDKIKSIAIEFPDLNTGWLLTGEGDMLKTTPSSYSVSATHRGVPYYDVDFIGGFDVVLNDQSRNPDYYIDFPAYNKADAWANITGHSMEPLISHGDMIALKKIEDWQNYILYGEVYGIVTSEYRTVKKVRKSAKGEDYLRLVPVNPEFDEQDIHKSIVLGVFQIIGCAKRIF